MKRPFAFTGRTAARMAARIAATFLTITLLLVAASACGTPEAAPAGTEPAAAEPATVEPTATRSIYLPAMGGESDAQVRPGDLAYVGAFRLPGAGERPRTFAYGGNAMAFRPDGDPGGADDGFPGSLFITGHDRLAYGELPDGSQVAEVSIPQPAVAGSPGELPEAGFLQDFHDVAAGQFPGLDEIPRIGLAYLDAPATGPKLHLAWGQHMQPDTPIASHAWVNVDLANPGFQGPWFVGEQRLDSVNGYLFPIPAGWAEAHTGGRPLATGRYRDGGWSGMGPALFAYRPWDENGAPAPAGARLAETVLLRYASSEETDAIERCLNGYQHPDEWEGGAWITTPSSKSAVLFAGTKGTGALYWYGYVNPAGPAQPCVDADLVGTFDVCRQADGTPCPDADLTECAGHNDDRGWWSSRFEAQFLLYDPAVLAQVAAGTLAPWQPQPYAVVRIDEHLFLDPPDEERAMLGTGVQRRMRVGPAAYDRASGLLYVLELFADGAKPVVHVWRVG